MTFIVYLKTKKGYRNLNFLLIRIMELIFKLINLKYPNFSRK